VKKIKIESTRVFTKPKEELFQPYLKQADSIRKSQKIYYDKNTDRLLKSKRDNYNNNPIAKQKHKILVDAYRLKKRTERQLKQLQSLAVQFNQTLVPQA
jgi:hypothetical protein